jgi:hypothetical protein
MKHVVMFSGGVGSWATAKRVAARHGTDDLILLFADTRMEDLDLYRFIEEAAANVGGQFVKIEDGRTPWDVFWDVRLIGNTQKDPCSRVLKREPLRRWLEDNHDPEDTTIYIGIDWTEVHRFKGAVERHLPWAVEAPMTEAPYMDKQDMLRVLREEGICPPRLYQEGFPHNNCGGFCVKAGQKQFQHLLERRRELYLWHERKEQEMREMLGKDVAILRDRRENETTPLTLKALRERIEFNGYQAPLFDWGGCACLA